MSKELMDKTDKKILEILQENGRTSYSEIGKKVGMTHVGAKRRLERLINEGIIEISARISADKMNLKAVLVLVEMEGYSKLKKAINTIKNCPRMAMAAIMSGGYNLAILAVAENIETLESMLIGECAIRNQEGVKRTEVYLIDTLIHPKFIPLRISADKKLKDAPCGYTCHTCDRYRDEKCLGCPATIHYRGPL